MNGLASIFGHLREQLSEIGESIFGGQAQRGLDADIRDTDAHLHEWRAHLATFQANRLTANERIERTAATIQQREAQALSALRTGKTALAREVATAIVQLEQARDDERAFVAQLDGRIAQMRQLIEQGENNLRRLQHQLDALRAAEAVQRAQEIIASRQSGPSTLPQTAIESLLRARRQKNAPDEQSVRPARDPAASELDGRLEAAGIGEHDTRAQLVLERIGQRMAEPASTRGRRRKPDPDQEPR
ncbi:PspA/IM30 family protein [Luteimonas aquatica]|uniref:PspA/IM30 family protein n=1 Tax=Luteimonas aquatica TaxID=450364 RepID=UPI001F58D88D|nr:PspA/IM30 family protein [Luteimonas aquatica]